MTSTSPPTAWARSERDSEVVAHAPAGRRGQGRPLIAGEDVAPLALLALAGLAAILIIDPRGSMVFIDDWAYRRSAAELALTGTFAPHPWSAANILGHTVWGAAFVRVLGDQPMAYTASTLVLGYLGGAALYLWLRQVGTGRALALFAAGCLLANPIYLALSVTFMTDVPYAAVQTLALLLLGTALASGRPLLAAAGWVVAVFALSWRQVALAIPLAMAVARLVTAPRRVAVLGLAILPVLAFLVLQRGYEASLAAPASPRCSSTSTPRRSASSCAAPWPSSPWPPPSASFTHCSISASSGYRSSSSPMPRWLAGSAAGRQPFMPPCSPPQPVSPG